MVIYHSFYKNIKQHNHFQPMFHEQLIIILEWFLKDHMPLKTGVLILKILLWSQE